MLVLMALNFYTCFFADDSLSFLRANRGECNKVKGLLKIYEEGSEQKINFEKSSLFSSLNNSKECRDVVKNTFGIQAMSNLEKYLRLPSFVGRNKKHAFKGILDKIGQCIKN